MLKPILHLRAQSVDINSSGPEDGELLNPLLPQNRPPLELVTPILDLRIGSLGQGQTTPLRQSVPQEYRTPPGRSDRPLDDNEYISIRGNIPTISPYLRPSKPLPQPNSTYSDGEQRQHRGTDGVQSAVCRLSDLRFGCDFGNHEPLWGRFPELCTASDVARVAEKS